jgi:putative nucleotidyltransferase with HDIG domain
MTRDDALALLHDWVENDGLRKHMLSVEAAMRHYAGLLGQDAELWGTAGLLHDLDWEKHPDEHPRRALAHLRSLGEPEEVLGAIEAHAPDRTGRQPESLMERTLYACDELSGLVFACCLVRPNGIDDLKPRSVVKKLKDRAFAAGVNRDEVDRGIELLGMDRGEHIQNVIDGMRARAAELGIRAEDVGRA